MNLRHATVIANFLAGQSNLVCDAEINDLIGWLREMSNHHNSPSLRYSQPCLFCGIRGEIIGSVFGVEISVEIECQNNLISIQEEREINRVNDKLWQICRFCRDESY